ncbi:hypothetical protein WJX73_002273 [Symbiochloris irregularis]|uniref:Uncharacterized protein n=1 Tax=Symbiochloris irregularis TaxID=706552 RepID=A0AAW1P3Z1_9CHLO
MLQEQTRDEAQKLDCSEADRVELTATLGCLLQRVQVKLLATLGQQGSTVRSDCEESQQPSISPPENMVTPEDVLQLEQQVESAARKALLLQPPPAMAEMLGGTAAKLPAARARLEEALLRLNRVMGAMRQEPSFGGAVPQTTPAQNDATAAAAAMRHSAAKVLADQQAPWHSL